MNKIFFIIIFSSLIVFINSCNHTISEEEKIVLNEQLDTLNLKLVDENSMKILKRVQSSSNIILDKINVENKGKNKYVIDEFLISSELNLFRDQAKLMGRFMDSATIDLMIQQSTIENDYLIDNRIFEDFLNKEKNTLINSSEQDDYKDGIVFKLSYPFYTTSRESAIVVTHCKVGNLNKEWASILTLNNKEEWKNVITLVLGKDGIAVEFLKGKE